MNFLQNESPIRQSISDTLLMIFILYIHGKVRKQSDRTVVERYVPMVKMLVEMSKEARFGFSHASFKDFFGFQELVD